MKTEFTITYAAETVLGERGFSYRIYYGGRLLAEGWSRGKKIDAENDARDYVRKREAA